MRNKYISQVKPKFAEIEIWLRDGLSEKQICKNLRVGQTSWETYKHKYPDLIEVIKKGRESQLTEITNSLYKLATGYYYSVEEVHKTKDSEGNELLTKVSVKKFKGPEAGAVIFFLKNKDRKNWCDNPQMIELKREEFEHKKTMDKDFGSW